MSNRRNDPSIITPRGVVAWAQLNEPDYKYKEEGEFHVRVRLDTDDPKYNELVALAEKVRDEFFDETLARLTAEKKGALAKKLHKVDVIKEEVDKETGDPTGAMVLRAGRVYHVTVKNGPKAGKEYFFKPDFFNAQRIRLKNPPKIGSGSEVKLSVELRGYVNNKDGEVGVSYRLQGVQILKLVSGGERTASDYGFEDEDGDEVTDRETGGFESEDGGFNGTDEDSNSDF